MYPVNPAGGSVQGRPAYLAYLAYRGIAEVPGQVELAVLAVPAAAVPTVTANAPGAGVKPLVVISAGFSEAGPEGAPPQTQSNCWRYAGRRGCA